MKTQKKSKMKLAELAAVAVMMAMGAGSVAHAEGGLQGGGGAAIVCKTAQGTTAQLLDLYNGEIMDSLAYTQINSSEATTIALAKSRMQKLHGYAFSKQFDQELATVNGNWIVLPIGVPVMPANDAGMMIGVPPGCEAQYAVNYTIRNGLPKVLVNQEILNQMSSLHQAALKIHEAVYAMRRNLGDQNSVRSQEITSLLVADVLTAEREERLKSLLRSYGDWADFVTTDTKMVARAPIKIRLFSGISVISSENGLHKSNSTPTEFYSRMKDFRTTSPYVYFDLRSTGFTLNAGEVLEVVSVTRTTYKVKFPDGRLADIIPLQAKEETDLQKALPDFDVIF